MRHWIESETGGQVPAETEVTKENVLDILSQIKDGYLPNWNYEKDQGANLPNKYYPLHVMMEIAMKAVEAQDDAFFEELDSRYNDKQRPVLEAASQKTVRQYIEENRKKRKLGK